jgi:two-component system response regulator VanR
MQGMLRLGDLGLNLDTFEVIVGDQTHELSLQMFDLLLFLVRNEGRVIPRARIAASLWDDADEASASRLNIAIHRLRSLLADCHDFRIATVRSRGYGLLPRRN